MPLKYSTALGIASFFVLVATLFFWLSALSTPIAKSLWYIRANSGSGDVYFGKFLFDVDTVDQLTDTGNFGWSAGNGATSLDYRHVGYEWVPYINRRSLTGSLILVALTAAFGTISLFALLGSIRSLKLGTCAVFTTMFTALLSTISIILIFSTFVTAHRRFNNDGIFNRYGPAFILSIIGWLLYLFSLPLLFIALGALRRARRDGVVVRDGAAVHETKTTTTTKRRRFF